MSSDLYSHLTTTIVSGMMAGPVTDTKGSRGGLVLRGQAEPGLGAHLRGEVVAGQVRCALAYCRPPGRVALRFFLRAPPSAALHHRGDGVLAHRPAGVLQISGDPRRPVLPVMGP